MGPGGCGPGKTGVKVAGVRERRRWSVGGISESAVGSCVAVAQLHLHLHLALSPLTLSKARNGRGGDGGSCHWVFG